MTANDRPQTIEAYIAAAPRSAQPTLRALHACLEAVAPEASQGIKWGSPAYWGKRIYFSFAAFAGHTNFYPSPSTITAFAEQLSGYRTTNGAVSFPHDKPLPLELIAEIAAWRFRDVEEHDARWM